MSPNLQAIDIDNTSTFSCLVNASGSGVKGYSITILDDNNNSVYTKNGSLNTTIYNRQTFSTNITNDDFSLHNGNDYKWKIRLYENALNVTANSNILISKGQVLGSIGNTIWVNHNQSIETDKYIQVGTKRSQIYWYEQSIGKVSLKNSEFEAISNGTSFSIYNVSGEVGLNYLFVDPNSSIQTNYWIAVNGGTRKKIIGYDNTTGMVRTEETFDTLPVIGQNCIIYSSQTGSQTTTAIVGGTSIYTNTVLSNTATEIYIQPNINIKEDTIRPNQIVFNDGSRRNLTQITKLDDTQWKITVETLSSIPTSGTSYRLYTDFVDSLPEIPFWARSTPTLQTKGNADRTIEVPSIITSRKYTFYGLYEQLQNIPIIYHKWDFYYIQNNIPTLVRTSGEINTTDIYYEFDGFENTGDSSFVQYGVKLTIETELGNLYSTPLIKFDVQYNIAPTISAIESTSLPDKNAIQTVFFGTEYIQPTGSQNSVVSNGIVSIPIHEYLKYENFNSGVNISLPSDCTYEIKFRLSKDFIGRIFEFQTDSGNLYTFDLESTSIDNPNRYKFTWNLNGTTGGELWADNIPTRYGYYLQTQEVISNPNLQKGVEYIWTEKISDIPENFRNTFIIPESAKDSANNFIWEDNLFWNDGNDYKKIINDYWFKVNIYVPQNELNSKITLIREVVIQ